MAYVPREVALTEVDPLLASWLREELQLISSEFERGVENILLRELHAEPPKPRDGMVVRADGTDWNPGSGGGFYGRHGNAWVFLG